MIIKKNRQQPSEITKKSRGDNTIDGEAAAKERLSGKGKKAKKLTSLSNKVLAGVALVMFAVAAIMLYLYYYMDVQNIDLGMVGYIPVLVLAAAVLFIIIALLIFSMKLNSNVVKPLKRIKGEVSLLDVQNVEDPPLLFNADSKEFAELTASLNETLSMLAQAQQTRISEVPAPPLQPVAAAQPPPQVMQPSAPAQTVPPAGSKQVPEQELKRLYYSAHFDPLTSLRNRFSAELAINKEIKRLGNGPGHFNVFTFMMGNLTAINETLGHNAGDLALRMLGKRLKEQFKDELCVARVDGVNFAIVAKDCDDPARLQLLANAILAVFKEPLMIENRVLVLTTAIGSSTYPTDGNNASTLISNAELAMRQSQKLGGNLAVAYYPGLREEANKKLVLERRLRQAVEDDCKEFKIYFLPKVEVATGRIIGCEALIRWFTPEGLISPKDFIPQAEASGLIVPLSWWIIRKCCLYGKQFEAAGVRCSISINIPSQVLLHDDFLEVIREAAAATNMDVSRLDIEIVESVLTENTEQVSRVILAIHRLGGEVSVDDFGTGFSSLSYLNKMAVDRIKIDRSLVAKINKSDDDNSIIRAIIAMAQSLQMRTSAEGVENESQYEFLKAARCDEIQGYFIAEPMAGDEFIEFIN